ncbi:hypothetical protein ABW19_dt0200573 [Dactylella cylindrospora]|nr:hypothetical protein ABW19_dt0200573 [Dactylella cylindrospora]
MEDLSNLYSLQALDPDLMRSWEDSPDGRVKLSIESLLAALERAEARGREAERDLQLASLASLASQGWGSSPSGTATPSVSSFADAHVDQPTQPAGDTTLGLSDDINNFRERQHIGVKAIEFPKMFKEKSYYDSVISMWDGSTFYGHRAILCERSGFFESEMSSHKVRTKKFSSNLKVQIQFPHTNSIMSVIEYLYTGRIKYSEHPEDVIQLYRAADYLGVEDIKVYMMEFLKSRSSKVGSHATMAAYIVCLLTAVDKGVKDSDGTTWETFDSIFKGVVAMKGYGSLLEDQQLRSYLEENGQIAMKLLCLSAMHIQNLQIKD